MDPILVCNGAECDRTIRLTNCADCGKPFCFQHKTGASQEHACSPTEKRKNEGNDSSEQLKKKLKTGADDVQQIKDGPVSNNQIQSCPKKIKIAEFSYSPFQLFYVSGTPIKFDLYAEDTDEKAMTDLATFSVHLDGKLLHAEQKKSITLTLNAENTMQDRRKDYSLVFKVSDSSGTTIEKTQIIRVCQTNVVGTPNFDAYQIPDKFSNLLEENKFGNRPIKLSSSQTGETNQTKSAEMATYVTIGDYPDEIKFCPSSLKWSNEEFTAFLKHELVHWRHFSLCACDEPATFWRGLTKIQQRSHRDGNKVVANRLTNAIIAMSECEAYMSYLVDQNVSYKFLNDYCVVSQIFINYCEVINNLKEAGQTLPDKALNFIESFVIKTKELFPELCTGKKYELKEYKLIGEQTDTSSLPL